MVKLSAPFLSLLTSQTVLAKKNKIDTKVDFGTYQGTYEGDISDFSPLLIGNAKQRSAPSNQLTPEIRRYSHLKLMISYIMGSGAAAAKFSAYGCHCLLGPDVTRTNSRVPAQDQVDEVCRRQTMCLQCAKIDNDAECEGQKKGYSFSGHIDAVTGERFIKCLNTPGTCRHSLCLCDSALADGFRAFGDEYNEKLNREWGGFNYAKKCAAAEPHHSSFQAEKQLPPADAYQFDYKETQAYDYDDVTTYEESNGVGSAIASSEEESGNVDFKLSSQFQPEMQCCGEYPERFPYKATITKSCCTGGQTYNPFIMQCCPGGDIRPTGTC